jgi:hypothetical protein
VQGGKPGMRHVALRISLMWFPHPLRSPCLVACGELLDVVVEFGQFCGGEFFELTFPH